MKYLLVLYMFSIGNGSSTLLGETRLTIEYLNYYDCVSDGYIRSYNSIMKLGPEKVMNEKLLITFNCEEINGIGS